MQRPVKAWIFLMILSGSIVVLGFLIGGRQGLLASVILMLSINSLIYFYADLRASSTLKGFLVEGQDPWGILNNVHEFTERVRIPQPKIMILPHAAPQALTLGRNWQSATIYLTRGLLDLLEPQDLRAVLAYQIAAIKNLDTLSYTVGGALAGFVFAVCRLMDAVLRLFFGFKLKQESHRPYFFARLATPLAALLIRGPIGKKNYLATDQVAAKLLNDNQALAEVLWKLESYTITKPFPAQASMAHFFIVNPLTKRGWASYLAAQPEVKIRIERLVGYYPL